MSEDVKKAQNEAKKYLIDKKEFDEAFEKTFAKYDRNRDGCIQMGEYVDFLGDLLATSGRKQYNLNVSMLNFERADKDGDGKISKEEFKKEFLKRMREFASLKIK